MGIYDLDPKKLQDDENAAIEQKSDLLKTGAIADNLSNRHSFGEFFTGHMAPKQDVASGFEKQAALVQDPWERRKKLLEQVQAARTGQDDENFRDPNSAASKLSKASLKGGAALLMSGTKDPNQIAAYQGLADMANDPTTNAQSLKAAMDGNPLLKEQIAAEIAQRKADASSKLWGSRLAAEGNRTNVMNDVRKDNLVNRVGNVFDQDHLLQGYAKQSAAIGRGFHTLENPPEGKITTQTLKEVSNEIAMALAGGASGSADDREKQEYQNAASQWAAVKSRFSDAPEGVASPELVNYLKANLQRLHQGFQANAGARAQDLANGRQYSTKEAQQVLDKKAASYKDSAPLGASPQAASPQAASPQQAAPASSPPSAEITPEEEAGMLKYAQENPGTPKAARFLLYLNKKSKGT